MCGNGEAMPARLSHAPGYSMRVWQPPQIPSSCVEVFPALDFSVCGTVVSVVIFVRSESIPEKDVRTR